MQSGFLCSLATPLLKATRRGGETLSFYSAGEFDAWKEAQGGSVPAGWHLKYYKGLGTSTEVEAQDWFRNICEIKYQWDTATDESMSLAFSKKRADDRKTWLSTHDPRRNLSLDKDGCVSFTKFVNDELIHYSNADNIRSLPSIMDGLKPSQRKILFACMKRGLHSEIRVAQLAGYVSEHASYHHGEASLNAAITSMAQTFVGANNINLLTPVGQFGTRLLGGKDAASARYIHTHLESITGAIFKKEDAGILDHIDDDGLIVEPKNYYPVVPLLLINGCIGIGTGFSTDIPPHNPDDIIGLLKDRLEGRRATLENIALRPWWIGFKGAIEQVSDGVWQTRGIYTLDDAKKMVSITELPVGTWTNDYKAFLDELCTNMELDAAKTEDGKPVLKTFDDLYNHIEVRFDLYLDPDYYDEITANRQEFEKRFHLTSVVRTSNMVCFDVEGNIMKYGCVGNMMEAYYVERVAAYGRRRAKEMDRLKREAAEHDAKARFIRAVLDGSLELRRATDEEIVAGMRRLALPPLSNPEEPAAVEAYEYLLRMRMDRVKATAVIEQERGAEMSRAAIAILEGTTQQQMWLKDLDEFTAEWAKAKARREEALADVDGKKRTTKKKFQMKKKAPTA
jgi:DNA topoisomerase-2